MSHEKGLEAACRAYEQWQDHEGGSLEDWIAAAIGAYLEARGVKYIDDDGITIPCHVCGCDPSQPATAPSGEVGEVVKKLREVADWFNSHFVDEPDFCNQAADLLEEMQREIGRLERELKLWGNAAAASRKEIENLKEELAHCKEMRDSEAMFPNDAAT